MDNKKKILVMKATDVWGAIKDCKAMQKLRMFYLTKKITPEVDLLTIEMEGENILFTVSHRSFPEVKEGQEIPKIYLLLNEEKENV